MPASPLLLCGKEDLSSTADISQLLDMLGDVDAGRCVAAQNGAGRPAPRANQARIGGPRRPHALPAHRASLLAQALAA